MKIQKQSAVKITDIVDTIQHLQRKYTKKILKKKKHFGLCVKFTKYLEQNKKGEILCVAA